MPRKRNLESFSADLAEITQDMKKFMTRDVYIIVGREAVNHFKESFDYEGFQNKRRKKWKKRAFETKQSKGKPILHGTGELQDSLDYRKEGNNVIIFSDKEYAQIMNEGGKIPVTEKMRKFFWAMWYESGPEGERDDVWRNMAMTKKKEITIPARQFMDFSEKLNEKVIKKIDKHIDKIYQ